MTVSFANLTFDQLRTADAIDALDVNRPSYCQQVWGQGVVLAARPHEAGPHLMQILEVNIDSRSDVELQELVSRIEDARGGLHPDVAALKR